MSEQKDWLSVEHIASQLEVSVEVVRGLIRSKKLVAYRIGKEYRIKREDFQKYLEQSRNISN